MGDRDPGATQDQTELTVFPARPDPPEYLTCQLTKPMLTTTLQYMVKVLKPGALKVHNI